MKAPLRLGPYRAEHSRSGTPSDFDDGGDAITLSTAAVPSNADIQPPATDGTGGARLDVRKCEGFASRANHPTEDVIGKQT